MKRYYHNLWRIFSALSLIGATLAFPQTTGDRIITVAEGQTIRDIARDVLGEPDLWKEILSANRLSAPSDLQVGMKLTIPVRAIKFSKAKLDSADEELQAATDVGAQVFAGTTIANAISAYNEAVTARKNGDWDDCIEKAQNAIRLAQAAHQETLEKRNTTADAVVTDRSGTVEKRAPDDLVWKDISLYSKLYENNRVRTLSKSYAEVTFQDQSQIRLNENSQAVIQKMRVDLLKKKRDSSVSLEKGAAFALLQTNQKKKKFDLNIPGVQAEINSRNFWVEKAESQTKIANYEGEIKLSSGGKDVILGDNQGSVVNSSGKLGKAKNLLSTPELVSPEKNTVLTGGRTTFLWKPVEGAVRYMLQVSVDYSFTNVFLNKDSIATATYSVDGLADGAYYWSVAAVDQDGFPGPYSLRGFFYVFSDTSKPFLYVRAPREQQIVRDRQVEVTGETEHGVKVTLNGAPLALSDSSAFKSPWPLEEGINKLTIEARDGAGNTTRVLRTVIYAANAEVPLTYSPELKQTQPGHFIAPGGAFNFGGTTVAHASVTLRWMPSGDSLRTFAGADGGFRLPIASLNSEGRAVIAVITPAGYIKKDTVSIQLMAAPPAITLDTELPDVALSDSLWIRGRSENVTTLTINGVSIDRPSAAFSHLLRLHSGQNAVEITGADAEGRKAEIHKQVLYDRTPPLLLSASLRNRLAADGIAEVIIKASDESGLKGTAGFTILVGNEKLSGFARFNDLTKQYEGIVKPADRGAGTVKLLTVVLEDYQGNAKEYSVN